MTLDEAKEYAEGIADRYDVRHPDYYGCADVNMDKDDAEAIRVIIQALEQQRWIPVSEQLPITVDIKYFWVCTDKGHQCKAEWLVWHWNYHNIPIGEKIIAWRELPEPYREVGE